MATQLNEFAEHLDGALARISEFTPKPYYEADTDSLIYYLRDVSSYSKRVTKYFTLFLANSDDSLVGFEVKGVGVIIKAVANLGDVEVVNPIPVKDGDGKEYDLSVVVRGALVPNPDATFTGDQYNAINSATSGKTFRKKMMCGA